VACVLASVGALCSCVYLQRLPHNDTMAPRSQSAGGVRRTDCMTSPAAIRWVSLLSLAIRCCFLAAITGTACAFVLLWTAAGLYTNLLIIVNHNHNCNSNSASSAETKPIMHVQGNV